MKRHEWVKALEAARTSSGEKNTWHIKSWSKTVNLRRKLNGKRTKEKMSWWNTYKYASAAVPQGRLKCSAWKGRGENGEAQRRGAECCRAAASSRTCRLHESRLVKVTSTMCLPGTNTQLITMPYFRQHIQKRQLTSFSSFPLNKHKYTMCIRYIMCVTRNTASYQNPQTNTSNALYFPNMPMWNWSKFTPRIIPL